MRYDLSSLVESDKAFTYLTELVGKEAIVEIKHVRKTRSLLQNNYLHLTFEIFGLESGYDAQESKVIYKRLVNPEIYVYEKNGQVFLKSSTKLTTKEMSDSIDKWRKYAAEQGINIPAPNDDEALRYWGNQIEREGKWL